MTILHSQAMSTWLLELGSRSSAFQSEKMTEAARSARRMLYEHSVSNGLDRNLLSSGDMKVCAKSIEAFLCRATKDTSAKTAATFIIACICSPNFDDRPPASASLLDRSDWVDSWPKASTKTSGLLSLLAAWSKLDSPLAADPWAIGATTDMIGS